MGSLYVIATPIGNLEDASLRSRRLLAEVDIVAAEDTRTARQLMNRFEICGPRLVSYFAGNEAMRAVELLQELDDGKSIGLISEAGTPAISDPGQRLVAAAGSLGHQVISVPGPSAVIAALVASGLPTQRFTFIGFLPRTPGARRQELAALRSREETLIFYESPERLASSLTDMVEVFGSGRSVALARELTKIYEEIVRGTCSELADRYAQQSPRGECTLVVAGADPSEVTTSPLSIEEAAFALMKEGLGPKDVAARLMIKTGKPRRELYQLVLSLRRDKKSELETE